MTIKPIKGPNYISESYNINRRNIYKSEGPSGRGDELTISEEAISFSKIYAEVKAASIDGEPDKAERIADIKSRIENGTYHVDSEAVVDSILGDLYI